MYFKIKLMVKFDAMVELFTDGAAKETGARRYGVILRYGKHEKEISEGFLAYHQ